VAETEFFLKNQVSMYNLQMVKSMTIRILMFISLVVCLASCDSLFEEQDDNKPSDLPDVDIDISTEEERLARLINEQRNEHGLESFTTHPSLVLIARKHSEDMRDRDFFSHVNPDGESISDRAKAEGIAYQIIGENIAWVALPDGTKKDPLTMMVSNWMESTEHRKAILNANFTHTGVGIAIKKDEKIGETKYYSTQVFLKPR